MLRLSNTRGDMVPATIETAANCVQLGTAGHSDVRFREGAGVMAAHAQILCDHAGYVLIDLGTRSGTYVGRRPIQRHTLQTGDHVALGSPDGPGFTVEAASAPALAPMDPDGRVDLATAQRLVSSAVARATSRSDRAASLVAERVEGARRRALRDNRLLTLGLVLTFTALAVSAIYLWQSDRAAAGLASQLGLDRQPASAARGTIPTRVMTGREIYDQNRAAVYVIGFVNGNKVGGVCTAFAIRPGILATNAHCIAAYRAKGGTPTATQNDSAGKVRHHILQAQMHPSYKAGKSSADSPDVALLRVDGTLSRMVTLANDAELRALGPGDDLFVLGFPGRVMDPLSPSLTFLQGHLGRLLGLAERAPEGVEDSVLLQHDAVTRGGNSGSPIFNQYGHVVAIHSAHLDDEAEVSVDGQRTTVVESSPYRVGMRVDLLRGVAEP